MSVATQVNHHFHLYGRKCHIKGVATKEQISEFFAKVRKTQNIINY